MSIKKSFTLIELLVVIAIIAILAGMLLPALNSVKESGKTSFCMNTVRQINSVVMAYTNDFDGWVPGYVTLNWTSLSSDSYALKNLVTCYSKSLPSINKKNTKFWLCPSLPSDIEQRFKTGRVLSGDLITTYGINYHGMAEGTTKGRISGKSKYPSRCAATGDSVVKDDGNGIYGNTNISYGWENDPWKRQFRHGKKNGANYTFFDGHGEHRKYSNVPTRFLGVSDEVLKSTYFWQHKTASPTGQLSYM